MGGGFSALVNYQSFLSNLFALARPNYFSQLTVGLYEIDYFV